MRLWSTVVSQLETLPRETTTESGGRSALAATGASSLDEAPLQVRDRRRQLLVGPVVADGRHLPRTLANHPREGPRVLQQRARRDVRPDVALACEAVAFRAHALERLLAERRAVAGACLHPRVVGAGREHLDVRHHRRVLEPAELGALAAEDAELRRLEGQVIRLPGDCVELATERRNPPAVGDVAADDLQPNLAVVGNAQP